MTIKNREKLSLTQFLTQFPDNDSAEAWFVANRWGDKITCPHCNSENIRKQENKQPMPFYCNPCRKYFSVKTGSVMGDSRIGYRDWAIAIYFMATHLKGIASTKLASELGITQKSAWHLAHRLREIYKDNKNLPFSNIVEADETFVGGKAENFSRKKRAMYKREDDKKVPVIGFKQRDTKQVTAFPIANTGGRTLQNAVHENVVIGSTLYTDNYGGYKKLGKEYKHESVNHSAWEYKKGDCHTNGIESFWSMLKRGYYGTFHHYSPKHMARYVNEFAGRHNMRQTDTAVQLQVMACNMVGKKLSYAELIK